MKKLNEEFFEDYKRLDKLLSDAYGSNNGGVTSYIEAMNSTYEGPFCVEGWEEYLKKLKRARYLRNRLAHDAGAFNEDTATVADVNFVKSFYKEIFNGQDPIAICERKLNDKKSHNKKTDKSKTTAKDAHSPKSDTATAGKHGNGQRKADEKNGEGISFGDCMILAVLIIIGVLCIAGIASFIGVLK